MTVAIATTTNSKYILSTASSTAQAAGLDTSYINSIMYGDTSSMVSGMLANTGMSEEMQAICSGLYDIVQAVIMNGISAVQPDVTAASTDLDTLESLRSTSNAQCDDSKTKAEAIKSGYMAQGDGVNGKVAGAYSSIEQIKEEADAVIQQLTEENEAKQKEIEENNKKIEAAKEAQTALAEKIDARKAELKIDIDLTPEQSITESSADGIDGSDGKKEGEGSNSAVSSKMSSDGIEDPQLLDLIKQYNEQNDIIVNCNQQNTQLTDKIAANNELIDTTTTEAEEKTTEQSQVIDQAGSEIVSMASSAQGAFDEVQNVLEGNFAQIDKVMLIKLGMTTLKAGVCETKSGLLKAAASTAGVGSIVSFGASAQKAAELSLASNMEANAAKKQIVNNAWGKLAESVMKSYMNQVVSNITGSLGPEVSQFFDLAMASVEEAQTAASSSTYYRKEDDSGNSETKTGTNSTKNKDDKTKLTGASSA